MVEAGKAQIPRAEACKKNILKENKMRVARVDDMYSCMISLLLMQKLPGKIHRWKNAVPQQD